MMIIIIIIIIISINIHIPGQDKTRQGSRKPYSTLPLCDLSFKGDNTNEWVPRPLSLSLLSPFTNRRHYGGRIIFAPTTGLNNNNGEKK